MRGSTSVTRNRCEKYSDYRRAGRGGVGNGGTLVMHEASSIDGNPEGGLMNRGTVTMNERSSIRGNTRVDDAGGGLINHEGAAFTMNDASTISDNAASFSGGVTNLGTLMMNGASSIRGNLATVGSIGGVANAGTLTMHDSSSITGNTAVTSPGGLSNGRSPGTTGALVGVVCGPQGNVYGNTPDDGFFE
jgi:hypothetical protein